MGHRRGTGAGEVDVERHRAGHAFERQIAGHLRLVSIVVEDDAGRDEARGRGGRAKEVRLRPIRAGTKEMVLEPGAGDGEAGDGDGDVQLCGGGVLRVDGQRAGRVAKYPEIRSEEHTSELQSLMRISYAVFCLKKKNRTKKYYP